MGANWLRIGRRYWIREVGELWLMGGMEGVPCWDEKNGFFGNSKISAGRRFAKTETDTFYCDTQHNRRAAESWQARRMYLRTKKTAGFSKNTKKYFLGFQGFSGARGCVAYIHSAGGPGRSPDAESIFFKTAVFFVPTW